MDVQPGTSTLNGQVPATGLSVTEAAQVLGVSPNTVRARLKAGKLRAERAQRPQGEVIRVFLDAIDPPPPTSAGTPRQVQSEVPVGTYSTSSQVPALITQAEALARLVQEAISPIERERDRLLQVTIDQAERLVRLEAELEQAQERIRALEAPREPSTAQIASGAPTDGLVVEPPTAPAQPQRPWWRFW